MACTYVDNENQKQNKKAKQNKQKKLIIFKLIILLKDSAWNLSCDI